jgi:lysophospholipid acyltransferase
MDSLFEKASISLGGSVAPDHLKLVFSILSTYVCAIVFKRIGSATVRHVFSILYTPFIMLGVLKLYDGFIHITGIAILSFLFMKYNRNSPWTNFTMVMSSMALW